MGASEFCVYGSGRGAKSAFRAAVKEAQYDYGHAGYTGSIAEKSEFVMMSPEVLTEEKAQALAEFFMEESDKRIDDKWGPCGCIEIKVGPDEPKKFLFFGWASS